MTKSWLERVSNPIAQNALRELKGSANVQRGRDVGRGKLGSGAEPYATAVTAFTGAIGGSVVAHLGKWAADKNGSTTLRCDWHPANSYLNSEERAVKTLGFWISDILALYEDRD